MNSTSGLPSAQQALLAGLRDQGLQQVAADPAGEAAAYARQALDRLCTDFADPPVDEALLAECTDLFAELDGDAVRDVPEQVFHLHAFDCIRVAQRNVEEQRQNLLLEKLWLKTEG